MLIRYDVITRQVVESSQQPAGHSSLLGTSSTCPQLGSQSVVKLRERETMNNNFQHFLIFLHCYQYISCIALTGDCLSEVRVADISSEQANITWTYNCDHKHLQAFKIYYDHIEYKACSRRMNKVKKVREEKWRERILPHERFKLIGAPKEGRGLLPYSVYNFTVIAIRDNSEDNHGGERSVVGETEASLPRVELRPGALLETTAETIRFRLEPKWRELQCDKLNSQPGVVLYEVRGQWGEEARKGEVSVESEEISLTGLRAFSEYKVKLYVTDQQGKFDEMEGVKFSLLRTRAGTARPPLAVRLEGTELVVWSDPSPPTGQLAAFQLSWREEEGAEWRLSDRFLPEPTGDLQRSVSLRDLGISQAVSVRLRTFIKEAAEGSAWSQPLRVDEGQTTLLISVILAVVILTLLVTATVLIVRKCNLIKKFKGWERPRDDEPIIRYNKPIEIKARTDKPQTPLPPDQPASNRSSTARRSVHDPLPEEPGSPLYEALNFKPRIVEDEQGYVIPTVTKIPKMASVESLDDEGYLKPNFNRFPPTDTRQSSGTPPPIPPVSYGSTDELERLPITTDF